MRVLFDAMERSYEMAGEKYDLVKDLYQGEQQSYIKCQTCDYESARTEMYQALMLPIKNEFGTGVVNSSVEMAIENNLKPETLDGDNQYFCEVCAKKVDAKKGMKLTKCPKIISLSLNRFTLDYNTFQRVKVTERVSFPFVLNLNEYMEGYEGIKNKLYDKEVDRAQQYQSKAVSKNIEQENYKRKVLDERNKKQGESPEHKPEATGTPEKKVEQELKEDKIPVKGETGIKIKVQ